VNAVHADILGISAQRSASKGSVLTALAALFMLTLRQHLRGRRLIVLCFLFLLPSVLAVIIKLSSEPLRPNELGELEFALVLNLVPSALATLTALLYAAGMVRDEVEEQTLTYLLLRPLPRWALYITKLLATILVTSLLTGVFTVLTMIVIYWDAPDQWHAVLLERAPRTVALLAVAQAGYCSLFAAVSLILRWALITGIGYIILFEGLLANLDLLTRRLTVMYYFRVLAMRWFDPPESREWSIELATAPSAGNCLLVLLTMSLVLMLFGAWRMVRGEFRMKVPEGS
jgi:ABC-2 type transport system permease protein